MEMPNRKQNRLNEFDYSREGAYFVTLCTHNRSQIFQMEGSDGHLSYIVSDNVRIRNDTQVVPYKESFSSSNRILHKWICASECKYPNITVDKYVIMPDHIHLLVSISQSHPGASLPDFMRFFKTMTTNEYIRGVKDGLFPPFERKLWQKSYYDHVIRNQQDYCNIWEYIQNNPTKWMLIHHSF